MRAWVFSDTHGRFRSPQIPDADVAIIAGDIENGLCDALEWAAATVRPQMPVVFVAGNHEYYGRALEEELRQGRALAERAGIALLEDGSVEIAGVLFAGATLWTDYCLAGENMRRVAMDAAYLGLNDHRRIATKNGGERRPFLPSDATRRHAASVAFLAGMTARDRRRPLVVVTHHAPSGKALDPRFEGGPLDPAFGSSLDNMIEDIGAELWVHGHTHACADLRIGTTRLVCNPLGYGRENPSFDPQLVVEISEGGLRSR